MVDATLGLSEEAAEYYRAASTFATEKWAPHAAEWDAKHIFPEAGLRDAAALGFGGLYVDAAHGGTGLSRENSMPIVEALAGADTSTTAYLTIHNMCAWYVAPRVVRRRAIHNTSSLPPPPPPLPRPAG